VRALRLLVDVRTAKFALERLIKGRPFDSVLSHALDRLQILEEDSLAVIAKISATRRRSA
jgi:hypothetical protein